jgi:Arc/MetJ-type ribon-helix-helix transcriptional regulator
MHTISIRLDEETYKVIEEQRGSDNRSEFCRKLINDALITSVHKSIPNDDKKVTDDYNIYRVKAEDLEELVKSKNDQIRNLENQNGFLISEIQHERAINEKFLMPSQEEQKEKGKKWFEFWK